MSMLVQVGSASSRALATLRGVDDAAGELHSIASELRGLAPPVWAPPKFFGTRLATPEFVPVTEQQAADATADVLDLFARRGDGGWKDDDLCFPRAVLAASRMERFLQGGISGPRDASVAGIAVAHMPLRRAGHHAAPLLGAVEGQRYVVDWRMVPDRGIVPLEEWQEIMRVKPRQVSIQRVLDNAPVGGGPFITVPNGPSALRYAEREVVASLRLHGNRSPLDPTG